MALGDLSMEDVEAGFPARFELLADTPGTYPLVLAQREPADRDPGDPLGGPLRRANAA